MNVSSTAVTNAANNSLFMVNFSERLLRDEPQANPELTILELKAGFPGHRYVEGSLEILAEKTGSDFIGHHFCQDF